MKRRRDWPERLNDAIDAARARPFSDAHHCAGFAADVVIAMTGEDAMPERRGTLAATYRAMREAGHDSVEDAIAARLGAAIPLALAHRGDVVLRETPDGHAIGICCGSLSAFVGDVGLVFEPTLAQVSAYRVPF